MNIFGAAIGIKPIRGQVVRVDPRGFTKLSSLGVEQQRVSVTIAINADDMHNLQKSGRKLGVEYRVRVRIYTATHKDTMTVPRTCLFRGDNEHWELFTVKRGRAKLLEVTVGITNDQQAEILEGLNAGDTVIVAPDASLTDGAKVKQTH